MQKIGILEVKILGDVIMGRGRETPHEAAWLVMFETKVEWC